MIKLTIIDPEGGEAKQKSQRIKDSHQKNISLRLEANRTEDNKGMDLYWSAHFSKKHSKDKDKGKDKSNDKDTCNYLVETTIVHPTDTSKNITQSNYSFLNHAIDTIYHLPYYSLTYVHMHSLFL